MSANPSEEDPVLSRPLLPALDRSPRRASRRGRGPLLRLRAVHATDEIRSAVDRLNERLGPMSARIAPGWTSFASACGLAPRSGPDRVVHVGSLAQVPDAATVGDADEFGFVVAAALRPGRIFGRRRDADPTMMLWGRGWSPVVVERLRASVAGARVEVVVGNARRTPAVAR